MALFTEEITPIQVPNVLGSTQPRAFLADSVIDPTTLPVDQSLGLSPTASIQQPFMFEPMKSAQQPSIVGGMFSPELRSAAEMEYLQNRQRAMQNEALAYAQLTPMQQAQYGFYRGGQQLGDVVGGALGGQDPQLRMIALQQQILGELDPSDPQQQLTIAQKYARVAPELAMKIADSARKSLSELALEKQRTAEKMTSEQRNALAYADTVGARGTPEHTEAFKSRLEQLSVKPEATSTEMKNATALADSVAKRGTQAWNDKYNSELIRLTTKEPKERNIAFGTEAERKSKAMYGKPYADLTPTEAGLVDKAVEASEQAKAKAGAILLPGQPVAPKDWLSFSSQISKDPVMDRTSTIIADAPSAIETIRMSATNDIAAASLPGSLARLTGEGKNMSDRDIARYARTGGLDDRIAQDVVGFFTGRKTTVTKEQAERFATAVYRGALLERKKFIKDQAEQAGYDKTPNYDIAIRQLDDQLAKFKLIKPSDKSAPAPSQKLDADSLVNKWLKKP
jgi:hypothetical protein